MKNNTERLLSSSKQAAVLSPFLPPNATKNPGHRETDRQVGGQRGTSGSKESRRLPSRTTNRRRLNSVQQTWDPAAYQGRISGVLPLRTAVGSEHRTRAKPCEVSVQTPCQLALQGREQDRHSCQEDQVPCHGVSTDVSHLG